MLSRRRGRPAWLFRQLVQGRFILRVCLIGLLLIMVLGFAGALQGGLSAIGAGQTELAYTVASLRNGARLTPINEQEPYSLFTTADANLQNYFSLDPESGKLTLRDGLKSRSDQVNPLGSFPLMIAKAPASGQGAGHDSTKVTGLYLHFLNCDRFLAESSGSSSGVPDGGVGLSEADRVLRCMQIPPVIQRPSTLKEITDWIRANSTWLLGAQRQAYLKEAADILGFPKLIPNGPPPPYAWDNASAPSRPGETPVWRLFILQDRADPGLQIYPVEEGIKEASSPARSPAPARFAAPESAAGSLLRTLDQMFLLILQLRYPVLIAFGILLPLLVLIIRQRDVVVRRCLEPYLLLLLAQVITLLVADSLMGEGLVIWMGFLYTLLRLLQLVGVLWMSGSSDQRLRRLFDLRSRPWLRHLLRFELLLWSVNALGLGWHILGVFRSFPFISPA